MISAINELIALGIDPGCITDDNGKITIRGHVNWSGKLKDGKIPVKLDRVLGNFDVSHNGLTTLENAPRLVMGKLCVSSNDLETMEGAPEVVHSLRLLNNPRLWSLEHAPFYTSYLEGDKENTTIGSEDWVIYNRAVRIGTWQANLTWDENCALLCKHDPDIFNRNFESLQKYFSDNRGAYVGDNLGII